MPIVLANQSFFQSLGGGGKGGRGEKGETETRPYSLNPRPPPAVRGNKPPPTVVFIANDWMTGLVPLLINTHYRPRGVYLDARVVLAIHNIAHQVLNLLALLVQTLTHTHYRYSIYLLY